MSKKDDQINVRLEKQLGTALRKSIEIRAKVELNKFNLTDFLVEAAKAHIDKWTGK